MRAYYNEFDPFAAAWLRELIAAGLIMDGDVDIRSIVEVRPDDLKGYTRCHFFAGIGGWDYALQLAGWEPGRVVWTGSCPCQPFSAAGKREGYKDERHLWPIWADLIGECRPSVVFGEQVGSKIGRSWLAAVRLDLEERGYAVGAADLPAASVGAPHKRSRLWFVAHAPDAERWTGERRTQAGVGTDGERGRGSASGGVERMGDPESGGRGKRGDAAQPGRGGHADGAGGVADAERDDRRSDESRRAPEGRGADGWDSPWADLLWLPCRDGKARPTQPGLLPLAHGVPNRVGTLRGAGNAIVPQVGAAFIEAYLDLDPVS